MSIKVYEKSKAALAIEYQEDGMLDMAFFDVGETITKGRHAGIKVSQQISEGSKGMRANEWALDPGDRLVRHANGELEAIKPDQFMQRFTS